MDNGNRVDTPESSQPDVKQVLALRHKGLAKQIEVLDSAISQIQAEYGAKLEELQVKKKTLEEALQHVVALLRFEGLTLDNKLTDSLGKNKTSAATSTISLTDAAYELLTELHQPLHYKELTLKLQERQIYIPGKDAAATLLSRINRDNRFKRTKRRGVYALSTWRVRVRKQKRATKRKRNYGKAKG